MMESVLSWLGPDEDRWCHLLQGSSFQLALEPLLLVFLQFGGASGEVVDEAGSLEVLGFISESQGLHGLAAPLPAAAGALAWRGGCADSA